MLTLPRGAFGQRENVLLATSTWASPEEVARFPYGGGGALFVGSVPFAGVWEPLRGIWGKVHELGRHIEQAGFPPLDRARYMGELEKVWMGALHADCMPLGFDDDRHFVTIAGARSGKGQSAIIPNLVLYPGSVVCLDPKGENASLTAARRGQGDEWTPGLGQEVYVLDPFRAADVPEDLRASLNPLALLDKDSPLVVDDAALLAEGLILPGGQGDEHWSETARNFVRGVILYLVATYDRPTLFDVRRLLVAGEALVFAAELAARKDFETELGAARDLSKFKKKTIDPDHVAELPVRPADMLPEEVNDAFSFLLWRMSLREDFDGAIAGAAESLLGTGPNERGSILSTARRNTAFLDTLEARYKATLSGSFRPFDPKLLKLDPRGVTVYLCLPAERMDTHGRWLRLMIGLFLEQMQRELEPPASKAPVLFLLEEFFSLGTMPSIEKAAGYAAGFGVKLWVILQDLQQLKSLYKTSWQTFLANAGAVQLFGVSDRDTLEYASQALGEFEVSRLTASLSTSTQEGEAKGSDLARFGPVAGSNMKQGVVLAALRGALSDTSRSKNTSTSESMSVGLHVVPLLRPDEIALQFARESGAALLLIKGQRPMWVLRENYNECPWLRGLYTPLPKWREGVRKDIRPAPMWDRPREPFRDTARAFQDLATRTDALP